MRPGRAICGGRTVDAAAFRARIAACEIHICRSRKGHGDVEQILRIRRVASGLLADGEVAHVARVLELDRGIAILGNRGRRIGGRSGYIALGGVVRLGNGVLRARRDAGENLGFAALEREGCRGLITGFALSQRRCRELHAIVVVQGQAIVRKRDSEGEFLVCVRRIAAERLFHREAADFVCVGKRSRGGCARGNGAARACRFGDKALLLIILLDHGVRRAVGDAADGDGLPILQREGSRTILNGYSARSTAAEGGRVSAIHIHSVVCERQREAEDLAIVACNVAFHGLAHAQAALCRVGEAYTGRAVVV